MSLPAMLAESLIVEHHPKANLTCTRRGSAGNGRLWGQGLRGCLALAIDSDEVRIQLRVEPWRDN